MPLAPALAALNWAPVVLAAATAPIISPLLARSSAVSAAIAPLAAAPAVLAPDPTNDETP